MRILADALLADLKDRTNRIISDAKNFERLSAAELNAKPDTDRWSALECLEHLNRYGDFYIPEINRILSLNKPQKNEKFKSGILGNYFAKMMLPGTNEMSTFKSMNPKYSGLRTNVLSEFIAQQEVMLEILERCKDYNLNKLKTSISISKLIKLRLGDTLRVVIYHNQRHMDQAKHAIKLAVNEVVL